VECDSTSCCLQRLDQTVTNPMEFPGSVKEAVEV
jgi:hypothetical protein